MLHSQHLQIEGFYEGTGACSPENFPKLCDWRCDLTHFEGNWEKKRCAIFWSVFCPVFTQIWQSRVVASSRESCRGCAETCVTWSHFLSWQPCFTVYDWWLLETSNEMRGHEISAFWKLLQLPQGWSYFEKTMQQIKHGMIK